MAFVAFKKLNLSDKVVSRFQDNVSNSIHDLATTPIIQGNLLKNVVLVAGTTSIIEHKLGRNIEGWVVVGKSANSNIWDAQSSNAAPTLTLNLNCSADVTINLWVF
jgi:hypothetical protein